MDQSITELYKKQISLTEWFEKIGHARAEELRDEDNKKRDRLDVLHRHIGLPFDKPVRFPARQVADQDEVFKKYLAEHGHELCAMRLLPQDKNLPKLRMRGHSVQDVVANWFPAQMIDPDKYLVEFVPHPSTHEWSTIFVVNQRGIFGEIIAGSHQNLTQGFYADSQPITFGYDFSEWSSDPEDPGAIDHMKEVASRLHVSDPTIQDTLARQLGAAFANGYLWGYFESVKSEFGTWFIDYNQSLGQMYSDFTLEKRPIDGGLLRGQTGSPGVASGRVRIVTDPTAVSLTPAEVLVCDMTSPEYIGLMQQACAIVTNRGGILCHAAIVARELGKPCVVGTVEATKLFRDGDMVEVDANKGVIRKI